MNTCNINCVALASKIFCKWDLTSDKYIRRRKIRLKIFFVIIFLCKKFKKLVIVKQTNQQEGKQNYFSTNHLSMDASRNFVYDKYISIILV